MRKKQIASKIPLFFLLIVFQTFFPKQTSSKESNLFDLSLESLMNITIATKTEVSVEDAPSIVSIITAQEISDMGARDLEDILRTIPGFEVTHDTKVKHVSIRGISGAATYNNKIRWMIDGHSLCTLIFGDPTYYLWSIPIDNIEKIELIRGPGSALYGANAFAGVVNIITKDGDAPSRISFRSGSYNTNKAFFELADNSLAGNNSIDDLKIYAYGDYFVTDGPKEVIESDAAPFLFNLDPMPGKTTNNSEYYNLQTKIDFKDFYFNAFYRETIEKQIPVGAVLVWSDEDDLRDKAYFVELGYDHTFSGKCSIFIKAYYDYYENNVVYELFSEQVAGYFSDVYAPATPYPPGEGIHGGPFAKNSIMGGEITLSYDIIEDINIVGGLLYEYLEPYDVKSLPCNGNIAGRPYTVAGMPYNPFQYHGFLDPTPSVGKWTNETHRKINALYAQTVFDMASIYNMESIYGLSVTAGVRYDDYDDIGSSTNPRVGLVFAPTKKLYFKALYGTAFRAPNNVEMNAKNSPSTAGNPNLVPETLRTIEGAIGYNFTDKIKSTITYFNTEVEDMIKTITSPQGQKVYNNVGTLLSQGIEGELRFSFNQNSYAYINATYQDVEITALITEGETPHTQKDFFPGNIPEVLVNFGVTHKFTQKIIGNMTIAYIGERKRSEEKRWIGGSLQYFDRRDPLYSQILVHSTFTFREFEFAKGLELKISAYNLFDDDHRDPEESGLIANDFPRGGRSFMGMVSYTF